VTVQSVTARAGTGRAEPGPDTLGTLATALDGLFAALAVPVNRATHAMGRSCTGKDLLMSASSLPRDELSLLSRLERLDASTVSDANKSLRVLPAAIRPVSARSRLLGRAVTAIARGDLLSVLGALQHSGPGDVLVVAAGGSRHAVAGELFASEAARRGLAGIVIDGFCRDTATLKRMIMPIYARSDAACGQRHGHARDQRAGAAR
jgi:regulator of ribonuclease E activity RraA/HMG-CHA aldolase family protein